MEIMPTWMIIVLSASAIAVALLVRYLWVSGAEARAKARETATREYWWPKPTPERTAKLHAMIVMLLTGTCFLLDWPLVGMVGMGISVFTWVVCVLVDYTDEYITAMKAALGDVAVAEVATAHPIEVPQTAPVTLA